MMLKLKKKTSIDDIDAVEPQVSILKTFKVHGKDLDGNRFKRIVRAQTRIEVKLSLEREGLLDFQIDERRKLTEIQIGRAVPQADLLNFTRQMAAFSAAGLDVLEALSLLSRSSKNKELRKILNEMIVEIRGGETLANSARNHDQVFPNYYVAILEASERTGDLGETFEILASYLERDLTSVRAVKSALYYPIILIVLAVATVFILSTIVLPKFAVFFASLDAKLPLSTRILISTSSFVATYWLVILLFTMVIVVASFLFKRTSKGEKFFDSLLLRVPIFGKIVTTILLERFTRVLASLVNAGTPLPDSLDLASSAVDNRVYRDAINYAREGVVRGEGLSEPLNETKVLPEEAIQMLRVGEQSGRLSSQLEHTSVYYAKEVDYKLKNLTTILEPVVLLIVGGGVGFVAIALVSAMYGIYSSSTLTE